LSFCTTRLFGAIPRFYDWRVEKVPIFIGLQNFRTIFSNPDKPWLMNMFQRLYWGLFTSWSCRHHGRADLLDPKCLQQGTVPLPGVVPMLVPGVVFTLVWRHIYDPVLVQSIRSLRR
jgi:ABC-type sugar transport system permease subunit